MTYALGVDLGTTYTAAAVWRNGSAEPVSLGYRNAAVPSVVLVREGGTVLVGEAAEERARSEPDRVARAVKRRLGDATPLILGGEPHSPASLMARQLAAVLAVVTEREGAPPARVALAHPANWGGYKLDQLRQVARLAGLDPTGDGVVLVPEPVAAALHHAAERPLPDGAVLVVYDFGGGTFDATVVQVRDARFQLLGTPEGVEHLGGLDVDAAVLAHVRRTAIPRGAIDEDDPATMAAFARLREECVRAKEVLSEDTEVSIPVLLPGLTTEVRLTRAELEAMITPLVEQTVDATRRALESAEVAAEDVHAVLLVGGSSRIPLVAQRLTAALGRPVAVDAHPKLVVADGAALAAAGVAPGPPPSGPPPAPPPPGPPPVPVGAGAGHGPPPHEPVELAGPGPAPRGQRRNRSSRYALGGVLVAVAIIGGVLAVLTAGSDDPAGASEVFAEPAGSLGNDPFTPSVGPPDDGGLGSDLAAAAGGAVAVDLPVLDIPAASGETPTILGDAPGLYGGTDQLAVCDREQLVAFLEQNPDKAAAWASVQGIDVDQIPAFVATLTDVVLQRDTRVTNHGFRDGRATPIQSVLQAGTAVLVDRFGTPRVRCKCGNPLLPPTPVADPVVRGAPWDGFDLTTAVVVVPGDEVEAFELDDLLSDGGFARTPGSEPASATPLESGGSTTTTTSTSASSSTSTSTTTTLPPPEDLTGSGVVTASSEYSGTFAAGLAVDGDLSTSWFSAGSIADGSASSYVWETLVGDVAFDEITVVGNGGHARSDFRTGFGFDEVTISVLDGSGATVFEETAPLAGTPDPTVTVRPRVTGTTVVVELTGHEAPDCGGFGELIVIGNAL